MRYQRTVQIYNGKNEYEIGYMGTDEGMSDYAIWIRQNGKQVAVVKLDPDTVKSNISNYTVPDLNTDTSSNSSNISDENSFKLSVSEKYRDIAPGRYYFWKYQLISNVDDLKIQKITINRGRCSINESKITYMTKVQEQNMLNRLHHGSKAKKILEDNEVPRTSWDLNYSDVYYFTVSTDSDYGRCRPQEVIIETNQGSSKFTWDL